MQRLMRRMYLKKKHPHLPSVLRDAYLQHRHPEESGIITVDCGDGVYRKIDVSMQGLSLAVADSYQKDLENASGVFEVRKA